MEDIQAKALATFERQKVHRHSIRATSPSERVEKLARLQQAIENRGDELQNALWTDLRKSEPVTLLTEIYPVMSEIKHVRRHLRRWMRPRRISTPLVFLGSRSRIVYEPKGVVLIMSPWNFPFMLTVGPLVSAIAAGNCVIVKPSEFSPATSKFIRRLISDLFDETEIAVLEGDHRLARFLVGQPFDHIFFTGSPAVGRQVMAAAAMHLTSVTLELGGKSPAVIDSSADIDEAAAKIAWGKTLNAGQSCVAPDYVLVPETLHDRFVRSVVQAMERWYGPPEQIEGNPDYGRIVNQRHFQRIRSLVDSAVRDGALLEWGGVFRERDRFIAPTVLTRVPAGSAIMEEEIFGPVLPVIAYEAVDGAIQMLRSLPRPLALYVFARNEHAIRELLGQIESGDAVVNDVVVHFGNVGLPFGGFNASGIGKAHGWAGFRSFSHERSIMRQPRHPPARLLYPPYTRTVEWLIRFTARYL